MKIRRLQQLISEQVFGRTLTVATGVALALGFSASTADAQTTLTFQQGLGGYTSVVDTFIRPSSPDTNRGTSTTLAMDGLNTSPDYSQALVRFDNLFGAAPGQIPVGAFVISSTFTVQTTAGSNAQSNGDHAVYRLTAPFTTSSTWNTSFGGDGATLGSETAATPDDIQNSGSVINFIVNYNVANALNFYSNQVDAAAANAANQGFLIHSLTTDGWTIHSSESSTAAARPKLEVQYIAKGIDLTWNAANTTGTWNQVGGNTPWLNSVPAASAFANGDVAVFSQDAASPVSITVDAAGVITPTITFSHAAGTYSLTGGSILSGVFTKSGTGNVVLGQTNDFGASNITTGMVETQANNPFGTKDVLTISNNATWRASGATQESSKPVQIGSGGATIDVTGSNSLVLSGLVAGSDTETLTKTGTGSVTFAGTSAFAGTVNINAGRLIVSDPVGTSFAQGDLNATTINVASGATFQFGSVTPITGENPDLPAATFINLPTGASADWYVGEDFGGINLSGGTLNVERGGPNLGSALGSNFTQGSVVGVAGGVRSMSINSAGSSISKTTAGTVTFTNTDLVATGALFINEGTWSTDSLITGNGIMTIGDGVNVATLQFRTNAIQSLPATKLTTLGAAGGNINVSDAAGTINWDGVITGGILNKTGPGTLQLNAANTYSGPTNINQGVLAVNGIGLPAAGTVNVANNAELRLTDPTVTALTTGLNLGATGSADLRFVLNSNPTVAPLSVTGVDGFVPQTSSKIILQSATPLTIGQFPLLDYEGVIGGGGVAGLSLVLPPRTIGTLVNNTVDTRLDVNITAFDTVKWTGVGSAAWEANPATQNWQLIIGGTAASYLEGDLVTFDDTATGTTDATLAGSVSPGAMVFNNSTKNYSITGAGEITGTGALTKNGTGTLVIGANYTSSGDVTVNAGTLTINSASTTTASIILNNGTLNLNAANSIGGLTVNNGVANLTAGQTISTLTVAGGTVNLAGANTITGVNLAGGTIVSPTDNTLGTTGTITATNNGLLHATTVSQVVNKGLSIGDGGITINVDDMLDFRIAGTTSNSGTPGTLTKTGTGNLLLTGGSSYTGTLDIQAGKVILQDINGGDLDSALIIVNNGATFQFGGLIGAGENPDLPGSTFITTKTGGTTEIRVGEDFGGINLEGGTLNLSGGNANLANASIDSTMTSGTITGPGTTNVGGARAIIKTTPGVVMVTGVALNNTGGISILDGTISTNAGFNNTGTLTLGDVSTKGTLQLRTTAAQTIGKPVTLGDGGGAIDVSEATGVVTWSGVVGGTGALDKKGPGTLVLSGANNYTGVTTVSSGNLRLNGNSTGATGAVNVSALATLGGNGTVGGLTTVASTGIVAPGNSAGNLTFANGVDLSAGGVYSWELGALSLANPGTDFDVITVSGGNLTLGGTSALTLDFGLISATDPNSADAFWTSSKSWKIIDVTGGTNAGNLNFSTITNASYTSGSFTTRVGTGGDLGDIFLDFVSSIVGPPQWTGTGDWSNSANWNGGVPNSVTAVASFLGMGTGTVTVDSAQTVNQVVFNAASPSYTIGGSSTLSLAGTTPTITNTTGSNTISAPLNLAAGTAINVNGGSLNLNASANSVLGAGVTATVATGATLNLGGTANALSNGTTTHANVANNGTLAATTAGKRVGNITGTGTTDVTAASAMLTASSIRQSVLTIGATSTATVAPSLGNKASGISVFTNTTGSSLSIAAGGNFDTNDNDLIVYYQPGQGAATLATIQQQIIDGFLNTPAVAKISSSTGAVDGDKFLVAIDNGAIGLTDWEGVSLTGSNQIIAKYTLFGDLNLDGAVDSFDYSVIDSNFGTGNSWLSGDSNLDGVVNSFDYSTVDTNFGKSFPSMGGGAANLSIAAVPEPSTFVLGGLGLLGLAGLKLRRRGLKTGAR